MEISKKKKDKITEQILAFLYSNSPKPLFTSHIAQEIARDEEFVKKLLIETKKKDLVVEIKKNPEGKEYIRRSRWKLTSAVYNVYKSAENPENK